VDSSSVTDKSFTLSKGDTPVSANVSYDSASKKATLDPDSDLEANTTYTATLTTSVKDKAGNALAQNYTWTFTTKAPVVTPPPTTAAPLVVATSPNNGATGVERTIRPEVTFDTDLKSGTVTSRNVKLQVYNPKKKKWLAVTSTPSYANKVITVAPASVLGAQKRYRVVLNTDIKSTDDKSLEKPFRLTFTTRK
jgi:hypothetical protein